MIKQAEFMIALKENVLASALKKLPTRWQRTLWFAYF